MKMKALLQSRRVVDVLLVAASIFCFTMYAIKASELSHPDDVQTIGNLTDGDVQRKSLGAPTFNSISPQEKIYNRDVVWVRDYPWAQIRFADGSVLRMREGTILVLNRSVKAKYGAQIDLLVGEIEFDRHWNWPWVKPDFEIMNKRRKVSISDGVTKVNSDESPGSLKQNMPIKNEPSPSASPVVETSPSPEPSSAPSPEPSMESAASPSPRASLPLTSDYQTLHPHEGAILFKMVGKETVVSFAWGKSETGTLEVRGPLGAVVGHAEVKNESHAKVLLAVESEYSWSVHDASGKAVVGPYRFKIYSGTKHKLVDLINGSEKAEIEMTK